ncbi:DUF551 domain-containing protein [Haemophilus haemoglobinophilus]|nr:DUF551 domain-containing protein [Canicola haemoglobinophilus]MBN6711608.1 DUF551 domain-containing protein [Canicola haemoglobinophilus]
MTKQNNGWISVDEKLPENGQIVLGYNPMSIFVCTRVGDGFIEKISFTPCYVSHWQELPQPPETE